MSVTWAEMQKDLAPKVSREQVSGLVRDLRTALINLKSVVEEDGKCDESIAACEVPE
mgnify:CR=1 FL=1